MRREKEVREKVIRGEGEMQKIMRGGKKMGGILLPTFFRFLIIMGVER